MTTIPESSLPVSSLPESSLPESALPASSFPVSSLWAQKADSLHQHLEFIDFAEAWTYMQAIAVEAEAQDHHPNWSNVWNQVTIDLTSHDKNSTVTKRDRKLAAAADEALRRVLRPRATSFAATFTEHLVEGRTSQAHRMFHPDLACNMSEAELHQSFQEMNSVEDPFTHWSVDEETLMTQWPDRADCDMLWAYCGVWGKSLVEAVTVQVAISHGAPKHLGIRLIEFGRP
jgi:4a-hydroxytetrahydrobiopterin dehydratase